MGQVPHVEEARPEDREAALRLVFQHLPASERDKRVANALHLIELGRLNSEGLFVVRSGQSVSGAMICLPIPGAGAQVWPPQTMSMARTGETETALIHHAVAWLRECGAKLGQALLGPDEVHLATSLQRNGFQHITSLWYMRRPACLPLGVVQRPRLTYQAYDADAPDLFARTLLRTYEGTRDCPEANGVRTITEILDGHKADAGPNLEHWQLAYDRERPVGVLLVSESAEWDAWEVAYVGVVPEARGQAFGRELMLKALVEAQAAEVTQLTLCVDARNTPAIELYRGLGFELYGEREVYLAVWQSLSDASEKR